MPARQLAVLVLLTGFGGVCGGQEGGDNIRLAEGRFGHALNAAAGGFLAPADERYAQFPLTVEFWVRTTGEAGEQVLLSHQAKNSGTHWELTLLREDGRLSLFASGFEPATLATDVSLADGKWRHVTMILEVARARLYVDGKLVLDRPVQQRARPSQPSGLGVGVRLEDRRPSAVLIDDVRISSGVRDVVAAPELPLIEDDQTISLWSFDESEEAYLARWTPGGETNQRGLPYSHRIAEYEFERDDSWVDGRWQETVKGPFLTHSTQIPGRQVSPKNMTVFLDREKTVAVMYDLERCAAVAGFTQARLKTDPARYGLLRKPTLTGQMQFFVSGPKAWWTASGEDELTTVSKDDIDYRGGRLHGGDVLLTYRILGGEGREHATIERGETTAIARRLEFEGLDREAYLAVTEAHDSVTLENVNQVSLASWKKEVSRTALLSLPAHPALRC
ncbi:MAG: LamG domain-containing protein [Planctomycetes bacterium]|nr:LamG domain-containing protein [Planctomycetota bacterium]